MHTNHLATKQLLFKISEFWLWLCAWGQGESSTDDHDSVFKQSLVNSSANAAYI